MTDATPLPPGKRPPLRADMRPEDSRRAAEARAAEILGNIGDVDGGTDEFFIDPAIIPDGWSYEWKTRAVYEKENPSYQVALARMGWMAVPASRHPEMMPINGNYQTIERKGMTLMERPSMITDQVRAMDLKRARKQVRDKEAQLSHAPDGQFERDHAKARPKVSKSFEPLPVPAD